jgi:hypothetical protein
MRRRLHFQTDCSVHYNLKTLFFRRFGTVNLYQFWVLLLPMDDGTAPHQGTIEVKFISILKALRITWTNGREKFISNYLKK